MTETFEPNWVSPPGDTVEDLLEERGWSHAELAERTGFTRKHVNELLKGRATITPEAASRLSTVLGGPVRFWLTREAHYRAALERQQQLDALKEHTGWLTELPVAWLVKQGWLRKRSTRAEQVQECLRYFGVASVDTWRETYAEPLTAFRASTRAAKKLGAVAAWLRRVEQQSSEVECASYDRHVFRSTLSELRQLTRETEPSRFIPVLRDRCAAAGVAVAFAPAPPGCPVHGATKWLKPDKAMLALTLRYKSNDQLWFSFFHEAAHILRHQKKGIFMEGLDGLSADLEAEADRFARDLLIPPEAAKRLPGVRSKAQVERFARELGIAPGIVVGRMQKEGWLPWKDMNGLKVRYAWT